MSLGHSAVMNRVRRSAEDCLGWNTDRHFSITFSSVECCCWIWSPCKSGRAFFFCKSTI